MPAAQSGKEGPKPSLCKVPSALHDLVFQLLEPYGVTQLPPSHTKLLEVQELAQEDVEEGLGLGGPLGLSLSARVRGHRSQQHRRPPWEPCRQELPNMATRSSPRRCHHHGCSLHDRQAVPCYGPGHATNVVMGPASCERP